MHWDAGRFWDAHEAWEDPWRVASGDVRRFLHGLIQVAAALVKARDGNAGGAMRNFEKALPKLAGLPPRFLGVDVAALVAAARAWHALAAEGRTDFEVGSLPAAVGAPGPPYGA